MHEVLVNRLGGLSLPRKSVVRLSDRPDMTLDVYRGRKTTIQQQQETKHGPYFEVSANQASSVTKAFSLFCFDAFKGVEYPTFLFSWCPVFLSCMLS